MSSSSGCSTVAMVSNACCPGDSREALENEMVLSRVL